MCTLAMAAPCTRGLKLVCLSSSAELQRIVLCLTRPLLSPFCYKKTYVLYEQVIANKQQALSSLISRLFCSLQVIVLPFSELGTVFQNMF